MKKKDFRSLTTPELLDKEKALKKELFDLNFKRKLGQVDKPHSFGLIKKDIARILTIVREREKDGSKN